jgi:hypothetical protein
MAVDYPYIQVDAHDNSDGRAGILIKVGDDSFGVSPQALADAVKAVLSATPGVVGVSATRYEMTVQTTAL